jgi:hypothetical protein
VTQLSIQVLDGGNVAQDWNLSSDPKLRDVYRRWYWLAYQGNVAGAATRPKVAALVNLWRKYHPELHARNVVVFLDRYQMRPVEETQIRLTRQKCWEFTF